MTDYLTDREKLLIARRAAGEYAVHDVCVQIHKEKMRSAPPDCPYMDFLHLICARAEPAYEKLEAAAKPLLKLHPPDKFFPKIEKTPSARKRRSVTITAATGDDHEPSSEEPEKEDRVRDALHREWPTTG